MNSANSTAPKEARPHTVLVIDDEVHVAAVLALGLEARGYRTLQAHDASEGWKLAHAYLPDLILSDIDMPGIDGLRLLQDMRADPALANRQFVLMTGKPIYGGQRAAMDLGADDFLPKPFTLDQVYNCVAARLKRVAISRRLDDQTVERLDTTLRAHLPQEFFTPLACILGLSELLQQDLPNLKVEEIRRDLREIHGAGEHLLRTLRNYLFLLDLEAAGPNRGAGLLDADNVGQAVRNGAQAAGERRRRAEDITVDLEPAAVLAKPGDLGTLVEELVDNALKFSRRGSPVQVRVSRDGRLLRIVVADAGRGLTPQQLELLHRPGPPSGDTTRWPGFGLLLVRRLVQLLGGTLLFESVHGAGTTVTVKLPIQGE